jgi:hypothetical protein
MAGSSLEICYILVLITAAVFMIWGFVELLRQPKGNEIKMGTVDSDTGLLTDPGSASFVADHNEGYTNKGKPVTLAVISRQLRGFALIMLAQIILVVGMGLCTGLFMPPSMKNSCK